MAHLPKSDVTELWNQMGSNKSWSSLENTLQQHKNKASGIDNNMVQELTKDVKKFENSSKSFPNSPQELYNVLNSQVDNKNFG